MENCAFCGAEAEGEHAIHRDGFGVGPQVPLCNACGGPGSPTCEEIWARIATPCRFCGARELDGEGEEGDLSCLACGQSQKETCGSCGHDKLEDDHDKHCLKCGKSQLQCDACSELGAEVCIECGDRWCNECWCTEAHFEVCPHAHDWCPRTMIAKDLKAGHVFSYIGSFKEYRVVEDAEHDLSYDGKVIIKVAHPRGENHRMDIRLNEDELCEVKGPKAS